MREKPEALVSPAKVDDLLVLDDETGKLFWKKRDTSLFNASEKQLNKTANSWNSKFAGKQAFTAINRDGYAHGNIFHMPFYAHRVVWAITFGQWPVNQIDHINGVRSDNRPSNLRDVLPIENHMNVSIGKRNTSGIVGVRFYARGGAWQAQITVSGKNIHLGYFKTVEEAAAARAAADARYGFHENHGRRAA